MLFYYLLLSNLLILKSKNDSIPEIRYQECQMPILRFELTQFLSDQRHVMTLIVSNSYVHHLIQIVFQIKHPL